MKEVVTCELKENDFVITPDISKTFYRTGLLPRRENEKNSLA